MLGPPLLRLNGLRLRQLSGCGLGAPMVDPVKPGSNMGAPTVGAICWEWGILNAGCYEDYSFDFE